MLYKFLAIATIFLCIINTSPAQALTPDQIKEVPLLKPIEGIGKETARKRILAALDGRMGRFLKTDETDLKKAESPCHLQIGTDGQMFQFFNKKAMHRLPPQKDSADLTSADAAAAATEFIDTKLLTDPDLKKVMALGANDDLKFEASASAVSRSYDIKTKKSREWLDHKIVVFRRYHKGIPFMGANHRILVYLSPDKEVVGFLVSLPRIADSGKTQKTLDKAAFQKRVSVLIGTKAKDDFFNKKVDRIECGYADFRRISGKAKPPSNDGLIQSACSIHEKADPKTAMIAVHDIPLGVSVQKDSAWPLAQAIAESGEPTLENRELILNSLKKPVLMKH